MLFRSSLNRASLPCPLLATQATVPLLTTLTTVHCPLPCSLSRVFLFPLLTILTRSTSPAPPFFSVHSHFPLQTALALLYFELSLFACLSLFLCSLLRQLCIVRSPVRAKGSIFRYKQLRLHVNCQLFPSLCRAPCFSSTN